MAGFPLLYLNSSHLEKIITKVEGRSYFCLQQTCRDLDEFIHKSRNISVTLDGQYFLIFDKETSAWEVFHYSENRSKIFVPMDTIYGARVKQLVPPKKVEDEFESLCDFLKNHRITCRTLDMYFTEWPADKCLALYKIVKPEKVDLNSKRSNRYEALLLSKTASKVSVLLNPDQDVLYIVEKLVSTFREVSISVNDSSTPFYLLQMIVKMLHCRSYPNLRRFSFDVWGDQDLPSELGLVEQLSNGFEGQIPGFQASVSVEFKNNEETISTLIKLPHFESLCEVVVIDRYVAVIQYPK